NDYLTNSSPSLFVRSSNSVRDTNDNMVLLTENSNTSNGNNACTSTFAGVTKGYISSDWVGGWTHVAYGTRPIEFYLGGGNYLPLSMSTVGSNAYLPFRVVANASGGFTTGKGLSFNYSSGVDYGFITCYDTDASVWEPLLIQASLVKLKATGVDVVIANSSSLNLQPGINLSASGNSVLRLSDNNNTVINPTVNGGAIYLNWDRGTAGYGVIFGNGAGGTVGRFSAAGGLTLGGGTDAGAGHLYVLSGDNSGNYLNPTIAKFFAANGTQGIGVGYDGLAAIGSNANQDFNIAAKGTGTVWSRSFLRASGPSGGIAFRTSDEVNSTLYISHPSTAAPAGASRTARLYSDANLALGAGSTDAITILNSGGVNIGGTGDPGANILRVSSAAALSGFIDSLNLYANGAGYNTNSGQTLLWSQSGLTLARFGTQYDGSLMNFVWRDMYTSAGGAGSTEIMKLTAKGALTVNHYGGNGTAPSIAAGSQIGTGGSPAVSLGTGSTDSSGLIAITTGNTAGATGDMATVTFGTAFTNSPFVTLTGGTLASGLRNPVVTTGTTSFTVYFATGPAPNTTYYVFYHVQGN
ncbi:MAG: hypothetical protein M3O09_00055, partial [Acidobacteriota bacterium]|nr:hypothetical protein [Acidobacteriota bacterium]